MARYSLLHGLAFALPLSLTAATASADPARSVKVDRLTFPITLADHTTYQMVAYHYHQGDDAARGRVLQVLVHGATYDHRYWDAPTIDGVDYSYARYMAGRGNDVLAIDQLGAGQSDQPPGFFFDLAQAASAVGQVLTSLRTRDNPVGHPFHRIALVGHSNGSLTSIVEESQNHRADALVITGWGHTVAPLPIDEAALAPLLESPYIPSNAFPESFRALLFYYQPSADPAMIAFDTTNLASTIPTGQFLDLLTHDADPTLDGVAGVTGPVLVQMGDHDLIAPSANAAAEPGFWTSAASVDVETLAAIGHDVNLHLDHLESWPRIDAWVHEKLGGDDCDDQGDD